VPDWGLNSGDPDVTTFDLGVPFLLYNFMLLRQQQWGVQSSKEITPGAVRGKKKLNTIDLWV
jgi:hypothetical protein